MKKLNKNLVKLITSFGILVSRFGFLPPNMSPVGSFGFHSKNIFLFLIPILGFDLFFGGFYGGFGFTYLGFLGYYILGKIAGDRTKKKVLLLPFASFFFFLISNFGVFLSWYPSTVEGFIQCYTLALPFYKNTLIGDMAFGYGFLAISEMVKFYRNSKSLKSSLQTN